MERFIVVTSFLIVVITCMLSDTEAQIAPGLHYQNCGIQSIFSVQSFKVEPNPPKIGKPISMTAGVNSAERVEGGTVYIQVKGKGSLSFINISKKFDICKVIPKGCPINKGVTSLTVTKNVPPLVPPGTYDVVMRAEDNMKQELICASLEITFQK